MKFLGKYWKILLALILVAAAVFVYMNKYQVEKNTFETKTQQLGMIIMTLESKIQENMKYAEVQDQLEEAKLELEASRMDLYKAFPVEMKEEDQIMYVLYLETLFTLQDGSNLQGLMMTVNYKTTYDGFQDMLTYLSTDSRVASVYESTITYDAENDVAQGYLTLIVYLLDTEKMEYMPPDVAVPDTGKDNIFE